MWEKNKNKNKNRADWYSYTHWIEENVFVNVSLKSQDNVDEAVEYFNETLQRAAWLNMPEDTASRDSSNSFHLIRVN